MIELYAGELIDQLRANGIEFDKGLKDDEVLEIENLFQIKFPPDLKTLLQINLPTSKSFIDWRRSLTSAQTKQEILSRLDWPLDGILFDIRNNDFWLEEWGIKPVSYEESEVAAKQNYANYPTLIPIFSHRYISETPHQINNPIFSVYQTDIIYYGFNLLDYFTKEFDLIWPNNVLMPIEPFREISFWSDLVS